MRSLTKVICSALLLATSPSFAADPVPVKWSMSVMRSSSGAIKGGMVVARVHAVIESGWHLYALAQQPGGPTPMKIAVPDGHPFTLGGKIDPESSPQTIVDPNFNIETKFYLNEASFNVPLKFTSTPRTAAEKTVLVNVLYQTCNDRMCLPATVAHLSAAVLVGK